MNLTSPLILLVTIPLISFFLGQINWFVLPAGFTTAISTLFGWMQSLNFVIPVDTITTLLALALVFQTALIVFKASIWFIRHLRGN